MLQLPQQIYEFPKSISKNSIVTVIIVHIVFGDTEQDIPLLSNWHTSNVQPLKFENGWVIYLRGILPLAHVAIQADLYYHIRRFTQMDQACHLEGSIQLDGVRFLPWHTRYRNSTGNKT